MKDPAESLSPDTFRRMIERAIAEPDIAKFHEMLTEIGQLLGVRVRDKSEFVPTVEPANPAPGSHVQLQPERDAEYDIFCGLPDRDAMWVESGVGIDQARARAREIASKEPNDYFVFCAPSRAILFRINKADCVPISLGDASSKSAKGAA